MTTGRKKEWVGKEGTLTTSGEAVRAKGAEQRSN